MNRFLNFTCAFAITNLLCIGVAYSHDINGYIPALHFQDVVNPYAWSSPHIYTRDVRGTGLRVAFKNAENHKLQPENAVWYKTDTWPAAFGQFFDNAANHNGQGITQNVPLMPVRDYQLHGVNVGDLYMASRLTTYDTDSVQPFMRVKDIKQNGVDVGMSFAIDPELEGFEYHYSNDAAMLARGINGTNMPTEGYNPLGVGTDGAFMSKYWNVIAPTAPSSSKVSDIRGTTLSRLQNSEVAMRIPANPATESGGNRPPIPV